MQEDARYPDTMSGAEIRTLSLEALPKTYCWIEEAPPYSRRDWWLGAESSCPPSLFK
jgi:hypothetical protein